MSYDIDYLFRSFSLSSFRLETFDHYYIAEEVEPFRAFQAGNPTPIRNMETSPWLQTVKSFSDAGKSMSRVLVVSEPISEYRQYELAGLMANELAGERIYILPRNESNDSLRDLDFWLFDDQYVFKMNYDLENRYLGGKSVDEKIDYYRNIRDFATLGSIPMYDYLNSLSETIKERVLHAGYQRLGV